MSGFNTKTLSPDLSARHRALVFALMRRLRGMDDRGYLEHLIAYHAAPTLAGIKPATLLCPGAAGRQIAMAMPACRAALRDHFGAGISLFRNHAGGPLVLVHQPALLRKALSHPEAAALLTAEGYPTFGSLNAAAMLAALGRRCRGRAFPHEIGLFLGYPPRDVRRFMTDGGRNHCGCGCWKTYHDSGETTRCAERFRAVRSFTAERLLAGDSLARLADALRNREAEEKRMAVA